MRRSRVLVVSVSALSLMLAGCVGGGGGGGTSSPSTSSPSTPAAVDASGIWTGTLTDSVSTPATTHLIGAIAPSGQSFFVDTDTGALYTLPDLQGGANYSGIITAYAGPNGTFTNGLPSATFNTSGTTTSQASIYGTYSNTSGSTDTGSYNLAFDSLYNQSVTLTNIAGPYTGAYYMVNGTSYTVSVTISSAGAITGTDGSGCNLAGQASVITTGNNLFKVNLTSSASYTGEVCAGALTGLAFQLPDPNGGLPWLLVGLSNASGTYAVAAKLQEN